jgi:hypothetical protein
MAGELLIQVIDLARFQAIRPALDELDATRKLSPESHAILREAATSPFVRRCGDQLAGLLDRILRHPELELRVFVSPRELDDVIDGVVHLLCFENGGDFSLMSEVGPNWVVVDSAFAGFIDRDWFRAIFLKAAPKSSQLAHPRHGEICYWILSRDDIAHIAIALQPLLHDPAEAPEVRCTAQGLACLAAKVLSHENLSLTHASLP